MSTVAAGAAAPNGDAVPTQPEAPKTSVPDTKPDAPMRDVAGNASTDTAIPDEGKKNVDVTLDESKKDEFLADAPRSTPPSMKNGAGDSSAKSNKKRRSSAGVPEHKSKKLTKKKSSPALNLSAKPGDYYWARMKGYAPWPSIICDEEMLPESLLANRPVTAMRPDGTYREDFADGGKNVKDRTYPVMYLFTNEFSWTPNTDLTPLDIEEIKKEGPEKKSKQLWHAYETAMEGHDLKHFKNMLVQHQIQLQEDEQREADRVAEREARKQNKSKRKSKTAVDEEGDSEMADVANADGEAKKSSRKRKKEDDGGDDKPAKTPKKSIKLKSQNEAGSGKSDSKTKTPKSAKKQSQGAGEELSSEQKHEQRSKEILYFRHKLQKGFMPSSKEPPKESEMPQMAEYFDGLEAKKDIDTQIIKSTKIHKVLKNIIKLTDIPLDIKHKFKQRSKELLSHWSKMTGEDMGIGGAEDNVDAAGSAKDTKSDEKKDDSDEKPAEKISEEDAQRNETDVEESGLKSKEEPAEEKATSADVEMKDAKDETAKVEAKDEDKKENVASTTAAADGN